jgi:hypothetical protein
MGRQGRWIGIVGAAVGLLALVLAAQAWACNNPAVGSSAEATGPVGPGQPVPFDFTGMDDTAVYTVSINGQVVASGKADGATVSGSFAMPDLGNQAQSVNIDGSVTDPGVPSQAGQTFPSSVRIQYAPPAPPAASNPSTQPTTASQPSSSSGSASSSSSTAATHAPAGGGPGASHPGGGSNHPLKPRPRGGSGHGGQARGVFGQNATPGVGLSVKSSRSLTGKATVPAPASHGSSASSRPEVSQHASSTAVVPAPAPTALPATPPRPAIATTRIARRRTHAAATRQSFLQRTLPPAAVTAPTPPKERSITRSTVKGGETSAVAVVAGLLLVLLALGASGAAAGRVLARRRPRTPPTPAIGDEVAAISQADRLLRGVDMDAELRRLLADGEPERVAAPGEPSHTR